MTRFQSARSLSSFSEDGFGFLGRRRRRRVVRAEREPRPPQVRQAPRESPDPETALVRLPQVRDLVKPDGPKWGPLTRLGKHLRVQAQHGHRAAVVELKPGMYLVAEIPEAALQPGFGVAPLLAPLLVNAAAKALRKHGRRQRHEEPEVVYEPPPPRQIPARWVDLEDLDDVVGCSCPRGGR